MVIIKSSLFYGDFDAENLKVSGELNIAGTVECNNCKFKAPLRITSKKITFKDSEIESLRIFKDGEKTTQKVYLKGNSVVHGDIVCEQKDVEIVFTEGAKVFGKIIKGYK